MGHKNAYNRDALVDYSTKGNGWFYFMQAKGGGLIKIGWTINIQNRKHVLQKEYGVDLIVLGTRPGGRKRGEGNSRHVSAHLRFAQTEQFRPAADLLEFIGVDSQVNIDVNQIAPLEKKRVRGEKRPRRDVKKKTGHCGDGGSIRNTYPITSIRFTTEESNIIDWLKEETGTGSITGTARYAIYMLYIHIKEKQGESSSPGKPWQKMAREIGFPRKLSSLTGSRQRLKRNCLKAIYF